MVALSSRLDKLYNACKLAALPSGLDSISTSILALRLAICSLLLFVKVILPTKDAISLLAPSEPVALKSLDFMLTCENKSHHTLQTIV
ncbi:hypothetical protein ACFX15_005743 [Malus domestica]